MCLVFGAVMTNIWLTKDTTRSNVSSNFIGYLGSGGEVIGGLFGLNVIQATKHLHQNMSRPLLTVESQVALSDVFVGKSDVPLVTLLEETAMYRLKRIIEQTEHIQKQVKHQGSKTIVPGFPAKVVHKTEGAQNPLGTSYPRRNFQRFCTDNVVLHQPDFVTLGHIKPHIYLAIGIATVSRPLESYLETTLKELFSKATAHEMQDVAVIVFLADLDEPRAKQEVKQKLKAGFQKELDSGSLH